MTNILALLNLDQDEPDHTSTPLEALAGMFLSEKANENLKKAITYYFLAQSAYTFGRSIYRKLSARNKFYIQIDSSDGIYPLVQNWLLEEAMASGIEINNLRAVSGRVNILRGKKARRRSGGSFISSDDSSEPDIGLESKGIVRFFYGTDIGQEILIQGHKVWVHLEKSKAEVERRGNSWRSPDDGYGGRDARETITFSMISEEAREAVMEALRSIAFDFYSQKRTPRLYTATTWGSWNSTNISMQRDIDTVYLPGTQKQTIIDDLSQFLCTESDYQALGMPWHRGYLFYGPPGTGKTSLAKALSSHFNLDAYYIPLSDISKDGSLADLMSEVGSYSIIIFEDIDCLHAATEREGESGSVSMAGLLNCLDGIMTPHGAIVVMTTNHVEKIDPAVLRPGRVDRKIEIGFMTTDQLQSMYSGFFKSDDRVPNVDGLNIVPAQITEIFKENLHNPEEALIALRGYVGETRGSNG